MANDDQIPLDMSALVDLGRRVMSKNFRQAPIVFTRGEGLYLWDAAGARYLDFVAGIAVNGLGHGHPRIVEAMTRQVRQLVHVSNLWFNEPQILLCEALQQRFGEGRVFLVNSGTEAVEAALKLARRYARVVRNETKRTGFVAFHQSFHGRTLGALSATGQPKYHEGFEPLVPGFKFANYNDLASVEALVDETTCAVIAEPIQAEGGLIAAAPGFLAGLRKLCDERGALLILDEVQTGVGRTGKFFAFEHEGVRPDIVTLAKALGAGFPIGAMLSTEAVADGFAPGSHGTTFGGGALAARVALTVLEVIDEDGLIRNAADTGAHFASRLNDLSGTYKFLTGARGRGLLLGLGMSKDYAEAAVAGCAKRGLLVNKLNPRTLRFLPPLTTQRSHVRAAMEILDEVMAELDKSPPKEG